MDLNRDFLLQQDKGCDLSHSNTGGGRGRCCVEFSVLNIEHLWGRSARN